MKIGLYQLKCPKDSSRGWYFIIDTSIQMGPQKCVVVLGVKKVDINQNFCPTLAEVVPLALRPLCNCPGEIINEILEEAVAITGFPPIAMISDSGGELQKGGRIFCKKYTETIHLSDISHKVNSCLKDEFENEEIWNSYKTDLTASIQFLKLSSLAHLAPPKQRSKARMHSAFDLIEWGLQILRYLNSEESKQLTDDERKKIEWVEKYQFVLPIYINFECMCKVALKLVHERGYYRGILDEFVQHTEEICFSEMRSLNFREKLKEVLRKEEQKIPNNDYYLGSSESLESLFGKFKAIERDYASTGLTSLVLAIPALVGVVSESIVQKALEAISVDNINAWVQENMGDTFLSKRRVALKRPRYESEFDLELCE